MTVNIRFVAQCPKCGNRAFEQPARLDLDSELFCPRCGHVDKLGQFADRATVDAIEKIAKQAAIEALKGIPGFKPVR